MRSYKTKNRHEVGFLFLLRVRLSLLELALQERLQEPVLQERLQEQQVQQLVLLQQALERFQQA